MIKDTRTNLKIASDDALVLRDLAVSLGAKSVSGLLALIARKRVLVSAPLKMPKPLQQISLLIEMHQPFDLVYAKAATEEGIEVYRLLYAEIVWDSERAIGSVPNWYLVGYCSEPNPKTDLPELTHNRTFRSDRLVGATPVAVGDAVWRSVGLDSIELTLELYGRLAQNYTPRPGRDLQDLEVRCSADTRRVTWHVTSWHVAKRSIFNYGSACQVITPDSCRQAIANELTQMQQFYNKA